MHTVKHLCALVYRHRVGILMSATVASIAALYVFGTLRMDEWTAVAGGLSVVLMWFALHEHAYAQSVESLPSRRQTFGDAVGVPPLYPHDAPTQPAYDPRRDRRLADLRRAKYIAAIADIRERTPQSSSVRIRDVASSVHSASMDETRSGRGRK